MRVKSRAGKYLRALAILGIAIGTVSCSGGVSDPGPTVSQIVLSPLTPTVVAGQNVTLSAQLKDASGNAVAGQGVAWTTSDASVATVSGGVVATLKPGAAIITATSGSASANTTVTVLAAIAQVVVTPSPADVVINQSVQLTASLRDAAGAEIAPRNITWSSSSDAAATVSSSGLVTGKVVGAVTITATAEGKIGTTTVNVRPVPVATVTVTPDPLNLVLGSNGTLTATTKDAAGNSLGRSVTWTSNNESIATVNANGVVTAKGVGTATITATSEGKTGTASVVVRNPIVSSVTIVPSAPTVEAGTTTTLTAEVRDENGALLSNQPIQWSTTDGTKVAVNADGVVTGVAVGSATITATSGGKSGTTTASVVDTKAPVLLGLTFDPANATVNRSAGPATLIVRAHLADGSGVERFDFTVFPPSGSPITCTSLAPESGTRKDGVFRCTITIPQNAPTGQWQVLVSALDTSPEGRSIGLGSAALEAAGVTPSRITVQ